MIYSTITWEGATEALERFLDSNRDKSVRAVFTTYNFHAESFQRSWMRKLRRSRAQVLVLADRRELRSVNHGDAALAGFQIAPVGMTRGVFHPKIVLVRAGDDLFAAIGSGNLSPGGLGGNLELQLAISTRPGHRHPLADGIAGFLRDMAESTLLRMQATARRFLTVMTQDLPPGSGVFSSLSRPLIDQVIAAVPGRGPATTTLLSPWHAGTGEQVDSTVIGHLRRRIGGTVEVLTDGIDGKAPDLPQCHTRIYRGRADAADDEDNKEAMPTRPSRLHAKSLIIQRAGCGWWFLGSANATRPALCQSVAQGGNLEVLAIISLDAKSLARLDRTWRSLFTEAIAVHQFRSTWTPAHCGTILGGELLPSTTGATLRLTACSADLRNAMVILPSQSKKVRSEVISFHGGEANVTGEALRRLLPTPPDRRQGATSIILEELHHGDRHPFIVSIPLLIDDEQGVSLCDRLDEELRFLERRWPVAKPRGTTQDLDHEPGDVDDDNHDTELDGLTSTQHQGSLDRLAEQLHLIGQHLSAQHQVYHRVRLSEICSRDLPPHLRRLVVEKLTQSHP